jgi:hypothetical protein
MNVKNSRYYAEGGIHFAEMCSTTYSYHYKHECVEKN